MAFDGITTKAVVSELNSTIINGRIDKISQPNKNEIILKVYCNSKNYALDICIDSSNSRLCITKNAKENPLDALNFCMVLRKHILGFRITSINTYGLDRIVDLTLEGYEENTFIKRNLIIELMGKHGNIILLDERQYIIDSIRHISLNSGSNREVLPNREYSLLQTDKNDFLKLRDVNEFYDIIVKNNTESLTKTITNEFIGMSNSFINYVINKFQITDTSINNIEKIFNAIKDILNAINKSTVSCMPITNKKNKEDFVIEKIKNSQPLEINSFIDEFYYYKELKETFLNEKKNLERIVLDTQKKYKTRLTNIEEKLNECKNKDIYRLYGELITSNLYRIKNTNSTEITLENYYDDNNLLTIPLDISISISANAKKYFKKYNKLKTASEISFSQKIATETDLKYIDTVIYEIENAKNINELKEIR